MSQVLGFEVDDRIIQEVKARNETMKVCRGCSQYLGVVRNCRDDYYCGECSKKVSALKKYSNSGHRPSAEETQRIFSNMHRAG